MEYIINIPNWHPTPLNKLLNSHWAIAAKMKRNVTQMISAYAHNAQIPKATGKRSLRLIITLGKGQRACDPDAYFKSTLDALVGLKYLKDDNRQWLELHPTEFNRAENRHTSIVLEDMQ